MKMTLDKEYQAKYMVLVAWVSTKMGLSEADIEVVINEAYAKHMKKELEDYCDRLFDGEEIDE